MIVVQEACEIWAFWSFGRLNGSRPSAWIYDWSWDPPRFFAAPSAAPPQPHQGKSPGRAGPRSAPQPPQVTHSNAPIRQESQSILSKIVALRPSKGSFASLQRLLAADFDSTIRRFDPSRPSQPVLRSEKSPLTVKEMPANGGLLPGGARTRIARN